MADDVRHKCQESAKRDHAIAELEERLRNVETELAKAKKHSGNSSKAPSSDIVNPKQNQDESGQKKGKGTRKRGGQPGHPRHERQPFLADEIDATGHKENRHRLWTCCFRASLYTVFKVSAWRGSQVLVEVRGQEFNGVLGCDYFSTYRKYMKDFKVWCSSTVWPTSSAT